MPAPPAPFQPDSPLRDAADLLRSARFRREREADWRRLDRIVTEAERRGLRALSFEDARDLAALYRQALNSLSVAREISLDRALLDHLEALAARACLAVYAPQETLRGLLWRFLSRGAPRAVRASGLPLVLGFLALGLGALLGYLLFLDDQSWYDTVLPPWMQGGRGLDASPEELRSYLYGQDDEPLSALGVFATRLFSHNTTLAIFAFSLGIAVCVPSFVLAAYNGLILGAFVALHVDRGVGPDLFGWLSIHGVTELSAIVIATAGGFRLGLAVLFPGRASRRAALRAAGADAAKLAVLAGLMLVVAALLEGFGRQLVDDLRLRLAIGWGTGAFWLLWLGLAGRGHPHGRGSAP
jgi:uncharacterized membrane protein SpoIIM required for sporulation